jgi:hypothetical protein
VFRIHHFYETLVSFSSPVQRLERVGRTAAAAKATSSSSNVSSAAAAGGLFPGHILAVTEDSAARLVHPATGSSRVTSVPAMSAKSLLVGREHVDFP